MYLLDLLKQYEDKKIKLFVDMDGVIADYVFDGARAYDKKRPLYDDIRKIEIVSQLPNVEPFILSVTRQNEGYDQKQNWLDKYAPFFKKENRFIISREENDMKSSSLLKAEFLRDFKRDDSIIIVIDDDPKNLKDIRNLNEDIILLKDTVLSDDTAVKLASKEKSVEEINEEILSLRKRNISTKDISDGFHTIRDYVELRNLYFIALLNSNKDISWKSRKHFDEETNPMFNGDFIAGIETPLGSVARHIKLFHFDELEVKEIDRAPLYDGYTEEDEKVRIMSLNKK